MMKPPFSLCLWTLLMVALGSSCQIKSDHVIETRHKIKPIEINVNVRVEKELDDFFEDLDEASDTVGAESEPSSES